MVDIQNIIYDGLVLSACAALFITITMRANPRIWLHDYPKDIQAMIDNLVPEHAKALHKIYQIDGDGKYMERFKKGGVQITEPAPELRSEMGKIAQDTVWTKWGNDQEKRKLPGKKVLEAYLKLIEKNTAANPFK